MAKAFLLPGLILLLAGCAAYTPVWTPETAGPPPTPPANLTPAPPIESEATPVSVPESTDGQPPLSISRDSAILTAIINNRAIDVARLGPEIGETYIPEARAAFDPTLFGSLTVSHDSRNQTTTTNSGSGSGSSSGSGSGSSTTDPIAATAQLITQVQGLLSTLEGTPSSIKTDITTGSLSVQQHMPTGTDLTVSGSNGQYNSNLYADQNLDGWSVSVTQPLLQGAGLPVNLAALRQARNMAAQSEFAFRDQVLGLVQQTETGYWDLVLANQVLDIRKFAVKLAADQLTLTEELYRVGRGIEGDVMAARAEKASRTADLTDAEAALRSQTLAMVQLLNPAAAAQWKLAFKPLDEPEAVFLATDPDASEELALQYRPDLAQARLDLANSGLSTLQARNDLLPRLDVVGSYANGGSSSGTTGSTSTTGSALGSSGSSSENYRVGLQFQQPILNRAEKARYRRARLIEGQTERTITNLEQTIGREVRQAAVEVDRQWQRFQATQDALQNRREQLRIAQGRFDVGRITNLDLLLVQRDLIQAQVDEATARINHIEALTALYATEGTLLERRGISLDLAKEQRPETPAS